MIINFFNPKITLPREISPIIYKTRNGKWGVVANTLMDGWFVDKYSVVEWAYLPTEEEQKEEDRNAKS